MYIRAFKLKTKAYIIVMLRINGNLRKKALSCIPKCEYNTIKHHL